MRLAILSRLVSAMYLTARADRAASVPSSARPTRAAQDLSRAASEPSARPSIMHAAPLRRAHTMLHQLQLHSPPLHANNTMAAVAETLNREFRRRSDAGESIFAEIHRQ